MPSSYSSNLLLELMADGENEGLWGEITNTNLEILGRAVSGVTTVTLSGTTHTLTVSQGALSEGHYSVLELGGSPTGTVTVTIDPNTVARIYVVKNSSGEDAIFTQGSGGNVTVSNGETKILYSDGAGASAAVTLVTNTFTDSEKSKLSGIETNADVTDTANVTAAGALMDSELTSEASVKALDQGVATTDSPDFAGLTVDTDTLYVDSSNNRVGIGTSSPDGNLTIGNTSTSGDTSIRIKGDASSRAFLMFGDTGGSQLGDIMYDHSDNHMRFRTNNSERMRINSSGSLLVGTTIRATNGSGGVEADPIGFMRTSRAGTTSKNHFVFDNDNGTVGTISTIGTTTSYNTSSDERLKENIADAQPASDLIDGIQVREFDWKTDGEHQRYGMIAQELETVAPEAVTKGETEDDMWAVDYSKLVPMLVKEIQDLRKRVNELENTQ